MFGPHVDRVHAKQSGRPSITAHIKAARAEAAKTDFDARAFQVFLAGPRSFSVTIRPEEADELKAYLDRSAASGERFVVLAHGTYLDFPWNGAPYPATSIRAELGWCSRAGISGLVVHLGKPGIPEVMAYLPRLVSVCRDVSIFLETPHVKPENSHYETPEKLADLFRAIRALDPGLSRFGLCIDTAHLWACGVDLRSFESAEGWLRRLEAVADVIPPERIVFHLNDSHDARGSGLDRHSALFEGSIWSEYRDRPRQSGLAAFVDYILRHGTAAILERKPEKKLLDDYVAIGRMTNNVLRRL